MRASFFGEPLRSGKRTTKVIDGVVTCNDARDRFVVALVNKDPENSKRVAINFEALGENAPTIPAQLDATILRGASPDDYNDVGRENNVVPKPLRLAVEDGCVELPPCSLVFFELTK